MALEKLVLHATSLRIPIVEVEGGSLTAIAGFDGHQGIALVVEPRMWASIDDVLARAQERGEPPLILVLDSLEDPQNVGTLLRSAEAAGVHGAIFPTHRQAPLTPAAVKASAGAVEHLALVPVDDLPGALADLRARGIRVVGADGDASLAARAADLRGPLAIIVGSEGRGLSPAVRRRTDQLVRIPMHGRIGSLNAAVAGSVLLYEATAQRDPSGTGRTRLPATPPERIDDDGSDVTEATVEASSESAAQRPASDAPAPVEEVVVASPKRTRRPKAASAPPQPVPDVVVVTSNRTRRTSSTAATKPVPATEAEAEAAAGDLLPGGPAPPAGATAPASTEAPAKRVRRTRKAPPAESGPPAEDPAEDPPPS
jgi:23S rRNA (guanosine2251-2'-O)-methyltransferase